LLLHILSTIATAYTENSIDYSMSSLTTPHNPKLWWNIFLEAWKGILKQRNDCVFNGVAPNMGTIMSQARDEVHLWVIAGAKGLSSLSAREGG
jgi:hypothetical protein